MRWPIGPCAGAQPDAILRLPPALRDHGRGLEGRPARIALQRQVVMYIMREETGASLPQIALVLGGSDHTVLRLRAGEQRAEHDSISRIVNDLRNRL